MARRPPSARVAGGGRRGRPRPSSALLPRLRDARGGQDDVRPARRAPDALRGPGRARVHRRADHPHRPPVGGGRGPLWARHRAQPTQRRRAGAARPPRRRGDLPDARGRPEGAPPPLPGGADAAAGRRAAPHGRPGRLGPQRAVGVRGRALPPAAVGHAVPLRQHADPVDRLRRGRRLPRRLRLRLHRRAARRRLPPRDVPHLRRRHGVGVRRPPPPRRLQRRPARRRGGAPPAHRARPRRRLGRPRPARRRRAAERPALRPAPRSRRARGGDRHGARGPAGRAAGADLRRGADDRHVRDRGRLGPDRRASPPAAGAGSSRC